MNHFSLVIQKILLAYLTLFSLPQTFYLMTKYCEKHEFHFYTLILPLLGRFNILLLICLLLSFISLSVKSFLLSFCFVSLLLFVDLSCVSSLVVLSYFSDVFFPYLSNLSKVTCIYLFSVAYAFALNLMLFLIFSSCCVLYVFNFNLGIFEAIK